MIQSLTNQHLNREKTAAMATVFFLAIALGLTFLRQCYFFSKAQAFLFLDAFTYF